MDCPPPAGKRRFSACWNERAMAIGGLCRWLLVVFGSTRPKRPKSAGSSHEWSWLSLLRPRDASVEFAWGQRRCVRDPAFTSPKEPCSQRASRGGTVLSTRTVDDCGRPRRSNCSCGPFGGRALPCLRAARRRCFDEHDDDPAADGALRAVAADCAAKSESSTAPGSSQILLQQAAEARVSRLSHALGVRIDVGIR